MTNAQLLINAIRNGKLDLAESVLYLGTGKKWSEQLGVALVGAIMYQRKGLIRKIIVAGADVNVCNGRPLQEAIKLGDKGIIDVLVMAGAA